MKVLGLFVLSFVMLSALPFLWNQFQFVEFGFPFVYLEVSVHKSSDYDQQVFDFEILNLVYDLFIVAIAVWAFTKIRPAAKNSV